MRVNLPKRLLLSFISVLALPKASRIGLHSKTFSESSPSSSEARRSSEPDVPGVPHMARYFITILHDSVLPAAARGGIANSSCEHSFPYGIWGEAHLSRSHHLSVWPGWYHPPAHGPSVRDDQRGGHVCSLRLPSSNDRLDRPLHRGEEVECQSTCPCRLPSPVQSIQSMLWIERMCCMSEGGVRAHVARVKEVCNLHTSLV